jgi:hypothetical protein
MQEQASSYHLRSSGGYSGSAQEGYSISIEEVRAEHGGAEHVDPVANYKTPGYLSYGGMNRLLIHSLLHYYSFSYSLHNKTITTPPNTLLINL